MAFNVTLYASFHKRINSTLQPDSGGTTYTGVLKEGCSLLEPVVLIDTGTYLSNRTYAYISAFSRYYYVTDIVSVNNMWEVHMRSDPMATYKNWIRSTSAYVERSASEFDRDITDMFYPAKSNYSITKIDVETTYNMVAPSGGTFVLGIINKNGSGQAGGAVTYYAMTGAEMNSLMSYLLSDTFLDSAGFPSTATVAEQITKNVARCLVKPMDYITSCVWFPVSKSTIAGATTSVTVGYWDFDSNTFSASKLNAFVYQEGFTATIPAHPLAQDRGEYLNRPPFTQATLYIPPFGSIPIDTSYSLTDRTVAGTIYVDTMTGKAELRIKLDGKEFTSATSMFGVPVQLAQVTPDLLNAISGIGSSLMNAYTGNAIGAFSSIGNALENYTSSASPRIDGVNGSFVTEILPPVMIVRQATLPDDDNAEVGRPLCAVKTLATLSGYVKCAEVSEDIPGFLQEKQEIQKYLTGGFFLE